MTIIYLPYAHVYVRVYTVCRSTENNSVSSHSMHNVESGQNNNIVV